MWCTGIYKQNAFFSYSTSSFYFLEIEARPINTATQLQQVRIAKRIVKL